MVRDEGPSRHCDLEQVTAGGVTSALVARMKRKPGLRNRSWRLRNPGAAVPHSCDSAKPRGCSGITLPLHPNYISQAACTERSRMLGAMPDNGLSGSHP